MRSNLNRGLLAAQEWVGQQLLRDAHEQVGGARWLVLFLANSGIVHGKSRCRRLLTGSLKPHSRCNAGVPLNLRPE